MFGLLIFALIIIIALSLLSRPVWRRRRYLGPGYGPGYGGGGWWRGWGWRAPLIIDERRRFEHHREREWAEHRHHHHHDGGWGGEHHHHHHDGGWGGGGHHHGGGGWGGGGHHGH